MTHAGITIAFIIAATTVGGWLGGPIVAVFAGIGAAAMAPKDPKKEEAA